MTPAERYACAADAAAERLAGRPGRDNSVVATGARALLLGRIGMPFVKLEKPESSDSDLYHDAVSTAADICVRLAKSVIDLASRQHGPDGYTVSPCDLHGQLLAGAELGELEIPGWRLGEKKSLDIMRNDLHSLRAIGIGLELSRLELKDRDLAPAARSATDKHGHGQALSALDVAAELAEPLVAANMPNILVAEPGGDIPLYALVLPRGATTHQEAPTPIMFYM